MELIWHEDKSFLIRSTVDAAALTCVPTVYWSCVYISPQICQKKTCKVKTEQMSYFTYSEYTQL